MPATREKNSTQFLPLNGGKPPSISFPLSPMAFARFVAIMSPGVLFRLGRENIGSPAPRKKGKRGLGKGETLAVVSTRFIGYSTFHRAY